MSKYIIVPDGGLAREMRVIFGAFKEAQLIGKGEDKRGIELSQINDTILGTGIPCLRAKLAKIYAGARWLGMIHNTSILADVTLGYGNVVFPNVVMTSNVTIGNLNFFNAGSTIGHDVTIGNYNVINSGATISGHVTIGNGVLIGTGARVLAGAHVGDGAIVGAGSVAIKDVKPGETVFGVPARKIPNGNTIRDGKPSKSVKGTDGSGNG